LRYHISKLQKKKKKREKELCTLKICLSIVPIVDYSSSIKTKIKNKKTKGIHKKPKKKEKEDETLLFNIDTFTLHSGA
jgi:hypothetical protein